MRFTCDCADCRQYRKEKAALTPEGLPTPDELDDLG